VREPDVVRPDSSDHKRVRLRRAAEQQGHKLVGLSAMRPRTLTLHGGAARLSMDCRALDEGRPVPWHCVECRVECRVENQMQRSTWCLVRSILSFQYPSEFRPSFSITSSFKFFSHYVSFHGISVDLR
jgi:hypothetical protein